MGMTREEAIEYFKFHRKIFCEDHLKICPKDSIAYQATLKEKEFYDMAIKALEQEPYREIEDYENEIEDLHNRLDIAEYDKERLREEVTKLEETIKALEQEPTTKNDLGVDAISRQAVIDELKRYFHDEYYQRTSIQDCRDCFIEDVLNHLPSVTPQEPKTGHWYRQTNDFVDYYECSECGMAMGLYDVKNYCPNCGSRNEVEE